MQTAVTLFYTLLIRLQVGNRKTVAKLDSTRPELQH